MARRGHGYPYAAFRALSVDALFPYLLPVNYDVNGIFWSGALANHMPSSIKCFGGPPNYGFHSVQYNRSFPIASPVPHTGRLHLESSHQNAGYRKYQAILILDTTDWIIWNEVSATDAPLNSWPILIKTFVHDPTQLDAGHLFYINAEGY